MGLLKVSGPVRKTHFHTFSRAVTERKTDRKLSLALLHRKSAPISRVSKNSRLTLSLLGGSDFSVW